MLQQPAAKRLRVWPCQPRLHSGTIAPDANLRKMLHVLLILLDSPTAVCHVRGWNCLQAPFACRGCRFSFSSTFFMTIVMFSLS